MFKNAISLFLFFASVSIYGSNIYDDLIAFYPFTRSANDVSGFNNNGIAYNVAMVSDRFNNDSCACLFNGTNSFIDIPNNSILNNLTSNFTLSAWIYQHSTGPDGYRILDKATAGTTNGWTFDTYDGITSKRIRLQGAALNSLNVGGTSIYSLQEWHHVVATVSGTNGKLYLNGKLDGFGNIGNIPRNTLNIFIGCAHTWENNKMYFNGAIDDVCVFNRALSEAEVTQLNYLQSSVRHISNVRAFQRSNTIIDIYYDLASTDTTVYTALSISTNGGISFTIPGKHSTGDGIDTPAMPGLDRHIVWYASSDITSGHFTNLVVGLISGGIIVTSPVISVNIETPPIITFNPQNQIVNEGAKVVFNVTAIGTEPLNYQWRKDGNILSGMNNPTLSLSSAGASDSGVYSVLVSNPFGSVISDNVFLSVLTDGANGIRPNQLLPPSGPSKPEGLNDLVIVTHGWEPLGPIADISWISDMAKAIQARAPNSAVVALDWRGGAWFTDPDLALIFGANLGRLYAKLRLSGQGWKHVHLIAHSAGSAFIEGIAQELKSLPDAPVIHETFLDPYTGLLSLSGRSVYGSNSDWSDNYESLGFLIDGLPSILGFGFSTFSKLDFAYNVDVGWVDPKRLIIPIGDHQVAISSHFWSPSFYMWSITNNDTSSCASRYGFALSKEGGGWIGNSASFPVGQDPDPICGDKSAIQSPPPNPSLNQVLIDYSAYALNSAIKYINNSFMLFTTSLKKINNNINSQNKLNGSNENDAAWFAVSLTVTNPINFIQFSAIYPESSNAQGLLTTYLNTNQIGLLDERAASSDLQICRFPLKKALTYGQYTLSFRLDSYSNSVSKVVITNLMTGFVGITRPITLRAFMTTNSVPALNIEGDPGYTYLLERSTNLINWTPISFLINTNGLTSFTDFSISNNTTIFYRACIWF